MKKVTKAVFPVAGLGTRFLPATKASPKEMMPIVDKPLIIALLAVPILFQDESIGVIELINKNEGNDYVRQEIEAVEKVAGLTATLIALGEHLAEIRGE